MTAKRSVVSPETPFVRAWPSWPLELEVAVRSSDETKRPLCPRCGQRCPYRIISWCGPFGHRCPHGEPCPSLNETVKGLGSCATCKEAHG